MSEKSPRRTVHKIVEILRGNPRITQAEVADLLGLSQEGLRHHLERLKAAGVLKRIGSARSGEWQIEGDVPE